MADGAGQILRALRGRLQARGDGDLAEALRSPDAYHRLSERRKAALDAAACGTGYLVEGRRVNPVDVEVLVEPTGPDPAD